MKLNFEMHTVWKSRNLIVKRLDSFNFTVWLKLDEAKQIKKYVKKKYQLFKSK